MIPSFCEIDVGSWLVVGILLIDAVDFAWVEGYFGVGVYILLLYELVDEVVGVDEEVRWSFHHIDVIIVILF